MKTIPVTDTKSTSGIPERRTIADIWRGWDEEWAALRPEVRSRRSLFPPAQ